MNLDSEIVLWLNQWVGHFSFLDSPVKLLVGDYFIPVSISLFMLAMWFWGKDPITRNNYQRAVLRAAIAIGFANLAVLIINQHYFRARPFEELDITLLFYQPTDSSFPANPTAVAFAMASGMWQANRKLGLVFFLVAAIWGVSRVYAGVFYVSDIVAGALIGIIVSYLVAVALRLIEPIPTRVLKVARTLHLA